MDPLGPAGISQYAKVPICGREISIRIIDNPGRQQLVPATMVILLFDLTQKVRTSLGLSEPCDSHVTVFLAGVIQRVAAAAGGGPACVSSSPQGSSGH